MAIEKYITVIGEISGRIAALRSIAETEQFFANCLMRLLEVDHCEMFRVSERSDIFIKTGDTRKKKKITSGKEISVQVDEIILQQKDIYFFEGDGEHALLNLKEKDHTNELLFVIRRNGAAELLIYATREMPLSAGSMMNNTCSIISNFYLQVEDAIRIRSKINDKQQELSGHIADNGDTLVQLNEKLQNYNQELQQFAYSASHDLQEPLRTITSYINLFLRNYKNTLTDEGLEFLEYASDGAKRMHSLIKDLLTYSRLDNQEEPMQQFSGNQMLLQALTNLQAAVEESNAIILYSDIPELYGNQSQLILLFQNLIDNAIKFRSKTEPVVFIEVDEKNEAWEFKIRDNGIGIPEQFQNKIFGFFNRLHPRDEIQGTGLGLSICKKIVERHNGKIGVESKPGKGSTFVFTLKKEKAV